LVGIEIVIEYWLDIRVDSTDYHNISEEAKKLRFAKLNKIFQKIVVVIFVLESVVVFWDNTFDIWEDK